MVQDVLAQVGTMTRMEGSSTTNNDRLYFTDLDIGDSVVVTGRRESNTFVATAVEIETQGLSQGIQKLIGYPSDIDLAAKRFYMFNIPIEWDDDTSVGSDDIDIESLISSNLSLEITVSYEGSVLRAKEIKISTSSI